MDLASRVRLRREALGLSQEQLAQRMGYSSRTSINKIENGRACTQKIIARLAVALNTTPAYLMGWEETSPISHEMNEKSNLLAKITIKAQRDPQFFAAIEALYNMDDDRRNALMLLMK